MEIKFIESISELESNKLYVYDGDLIGWTTCEILSENSSILDMKRVQVKTEDGTILNRFFKSVKSIDDVKKDGCVYQIAA